MENETKHETKYQTKLVGTVRELDEYLNSIEGKFEIVTITHLSKDSTFVTIKK